MSEYNLTLCDICAPGKIPALNRGYAFVEPEYALQKLGWEEQEVGHVCPACLAEQKERAERDVAEEATTQNGVAITLEEALVQIDEEEKKLLSPSTYEAYLKNVEAACLKNPDVDAKAVEACRLTPEAFEAEMRAHTETKRISIRKSFGQATPI